MVSMSSSSSSERVRAVAGPRGYALPLVLMLVLVLSATLATALVAVNASQTVSESAVHRRQAFHNAEGVGVAVTELASAKLRTLPMEPPLPKSHPDYDTQLAAMLATQTTDTNLFIEANKAKFQTPNFVVERSLVSNLLPAQLRVLGNGPFQGMQAQVQSFDVDVLVSREHSRSPGRQSIFAQVERATISMFQFYVFADGYLDLDPGAAVKTSGRIHANGDFCIAGQPVIETVTSAGRILVSNHSSGHHECRRRAGEPPGADGIQVKLSSGSRQLPITFDHTNSDWKSRALADYEGHLRDSAHDVIALRMPLSGTPLVQAGANVLAMEAVTGVVGEDPSRLMPIDQAKEDNTTSMRFLVDPMLKNEPEDVRRQKFAFKADIRIVDGVWFLRNEAAPETPGLAIWSDHPGAGDTDYVDNETVKIADTIVNTTKDVGQEDLRAAHLWPATPVNFSYYGFNTTGSPSISTSTWARTAASPRAVISYGLLHKTTSNSVWSPGVYQTATPGPTKLAATVQDFVDGTRNGIKNGWLEVRSEENGADPGGDGSSATETARSRVLPINFDIAGLSAALQNCNKGELGSYFPATCSGTGSGRAFNGIVFVTSTWPGQMDGLGDTPATSGFATLAPFQPGNGGANPEAPSSMCSASATSLFDVTVPARRCSEIVRETAAPHVHSAFPSVLRVFNGKTVSPASSTSYAGVTIRANLYPHGLTIATNLPIIAQGDINADTTPHDSAGLVLAADHFVPVLLAGDRFHRTSVNWQDHFANWQDPMKTNFAKRVGLQTTQYIEILAGWNPTPSKPLSGHDHSSDGFEDFPRYNECWSELAIFRGSIVVAFASVFERAGANNADGHPGTGGYLPCFPGREEGFDHHLSDPINQPPGAPLIVAQSVGFWQAR